jgi:serine/threonine-protein kinase
MDPVGTQVAPRQFLNYLNFNQGLVLSYPANWTKQEQTDGTRFVVAFISPPESPTDSFKENLNIFVEPLPAPVTLEDYVQYTLQGYQQSPCQVMETGSTRVADLAAYKIIVQGPIPYAGLQGKLLQVVTAKNRKAYAVTYTAESAKYDLFMPTIQRMLESLQIK